MARKPVIKYTTVAIPIIGDLNVSIVRRMISKTEYTNWINKTELTNYIDTLYTPPTSDTYMLIICQCGTQYNYTTKVDVPSSNLTCHCGRKLIEYII